MSRKNGERYPSDERYNAKRREKRRPTFFKVHTSILGHPKMVPIVADDHLLAGWLRLGLLAVNRGVAQTEDWMTLSRADLRWIFNVRDDRTALRRLQGLCKNLVWLATFNSQETRKLCNLLFRNFARKQGFTPRKNGGETADPAVSPLPALKDIYSKRSSSTRSARSDDEKARIENLKNDIDEATAHNGAGHLALALPEPMLRHLIGLTKEAAPRNPAAYLTTLVTKELAKAKSR